MYPEYEIKMMMKESENLGPYFYPYFTSNQFRASVDYGESYVTCVMPVHVQTHLSYDA